MPCRNFIAEKPRPIKRRKSEKSAYLANLLDDREFFSGVLINFKEI